MLKLFYVCYFVVIGVSTPFFAAYLRRVGLSGQVVSAILSVAPALQLGVPLLWGWLADRTRRPNLVLRLLCLGACLASIPIIFIRTMPALMLLYVAQQFFAGSITALADSIAIENARVQGRDYTRTRLWGSLSFIATCLATGSILEARAVQNGDILVPALVTVGLGLSFLASLSLRGQAAWAPPRLGDVGQLLRDGRFRFLLIIAGLHWLGLTPFHGFFGVLVQDRGLPATTTSHAFMLGSSAEILVFLGFSRLRARFSLNSLFASSFFVTALHWLVVAHTRSALLIVATQVLHAMTFGMFWATSMAWIGECVPPNLRATGQVLFSTTLGVGAMAGLLSVGALYDATGGAGASFFLAGVLEIVPITLVLLYWKRHRAIPARIPAIER
jgi:MFS transporter, PPP family, 3-phenylpropionic acid transporter